MLGMKIEPSNLLCTLLSAPLAFCPLHLILTFWPDWCQMNFLVLFLMILGFRRGLRAAVMPNRRWLSPPGGSAEDVSFIILFNVQPFFCHLRWKHWMKTSHPQDSTLSFRIYVYEYGQNQKSIKEIQGLQVNLSKVGVAFSTWTIFPFKRNKTKQSKRNRGWEGGISLSVEVRVYLGIPSSTTLHSRSKKPHWLSFPLRLQRTIFLFLLSHLTAYVKGYELLNWWSLWILFQKNMFSA